MKHLTVLFSTGLASPEPQSNKYTEIRTRIAVFKLSGSRVEADLSNCMDERVIWEKIARQQENRTGEAECYLNCCKVQFSPKITLWSVRLLINRHVLPSLSPSSHYRTI